ncbi:Phox/Bem1p [Corchorus olitorius]|uniref:Phox/Bem1p n=1 Tax=Corchorus olitorius TaxID=93759 RepID=A0A1R3IBT9_9ROSI|nr:Phox/Bem1p [Corchorus olitorius]
MVGPTPTIKFLCSYGGKILPRYPDGRLRYHGGETRVLAVDRSISFSELSLKMGEMCGTAVSLRCQLPTEDLDALVSITSDEDLANLIEEYDRLASPPSSLKIRAFLSPPKSSTTRKSISPPSSSASSSKSSSSSTPRFSCIRQIPRPTPPVALPLCSEKSAAAGKSIPYYGYHVHHGSPSHIYLIHNGNHWQ